MESGSVGCFAGTGCCVFILVLILVLTSLSQVQYNEMAFSKAWGQSIDQDTVYEQGIHMLGFWNSLIVFPADIVSLQLNDLSVFSKKEGDDAGTSLIIDLHMQYKLQADHLSDLFDIGGERGYITQIESVAIEQIKNSATEFNADAYLTRRREIETRFKQVLVEAIANGFAQTLVTNVQLQRVEFPSTFYQQKLNVGLQGIRNEIEEFKQEVQTIRKQTETDVKKKENEARETLERARSGAKLIEEEASNNFQRIVGQAREEGIRTLAGAVGADENQKDFLNLNYLVQILNNPGKQKKFVNFGDLPPAVSLL